MIQLIASTNLSRAIPPIRQAWVKAYEAVSPMWLQEGWREEAAMWWLAKQLDIPFAECYLDLMDIDQCERVVQVCKEERNE